MIRWLAKPTGVTKWKSLKTPVFSQSDYIFAMLIMQEQSLQEPSFSRSETDIHQKACLNTLWASIWDPFGKPKSLPNRSGGCLERHWSSDLDVYLRWGFGEVGSFVHPSLMYPSSTPVATHLLSLEDTILYNGIYIYIYIYILYMYIESRARFARALNSLRF